MFENTTVKRREEEPRFFEVWQNLEAWVITEFSEFLKGGGIT